MSSQLPWLAALAVIAGCSAASGPARAPASAGPIELPHPAPLNRPAGFDPDAANRACLPCHGDIAEEWERSLHRRAFDEPVFRAARDLEPTPFCRKCHGPESDPQADPSERHAAVGIGCTTCHGTIDRVIGVRAMQGGAHAVTADPRLAGPDACRLCHQFAFPNRAAVIMQDTMEEHARSSFSHLPCQACHMRKVAGKNGGSHASHDFSVQGRPDVLARALRVEASRNAEGALILSLRAGAVGHAVPTGDVFRRIELTAVALDANDRVVAEAEPVVLQREFANHLGDQGADRRPIADRRVPAPGGDPAREVALRFPIDTSGYRARWRIHYKRMEPAMYEVFGMDEHADAVLMAEGTMPAVAGGRAK